MFDWTSTASYELNFSANMIIFINKEDDSGW